MLVTEWGRQVIESELRAPHATAHIIDFEVYETKEALVDNGAFHLILNLPPRPIAAAGHFAQRWARGHYERFGDMFLLPPDEGVFGRCAAGVGKCFELLLDADYLNDMLPRGFEWTNARVKQFLDLPHPTLQQLLARLAYETRNPGFASEALAEAMTTQAAIEIARMCGQVHDGAGRGCLAPWRLKIIDERIEQWGSAPTLTELAALCNISSRQLTRAFQESRGVSIGDYIAIRRTENAKRALIGNEPIKLIAHGMGYASSANFCYAFRRATGETPGQYRSLARLGLVAT